jgi:hypothetical protein
MPTTHRFGAGWPAILSTATTTRSNVAPEIKAAIKKAAEADDRSMTVWVERALAAYLRQQGLLKK